MKNRTSLNFWLDLVSLLVMIALAMTGGLIHFVLPPGTGHSHALFGLGRHDFGLVHFYLGATAVALLAAHVVLHWSWICCVLAKTLGRAAPSRRVQNTAGVSLLVGVALLLSGSLIWAVGAVEQASAAGSGHVHRADVTRRGGRAPALAESSVERAEAPPLTVAQREPAPRSKTKSAHEKHLENCAAGAAINGRTSFMEAVRICGVTPEELKQHLGLPRDLSVGEQLGQLKRRFGFQIHDVRRLACR